MGRRGPAPVPIEQRKLDGTLRSRNAKVPVVIGGRKAPRPATWLTTAQRREFQRLVHELQEGNLLDSADRGMIELAAVQADILAQCNAALAESLTITVTRGTYRGEGGYTTEETSPFFKMRQDAAKELRQLYGELGIGPGARASLANSGSKAGKKPAQVLPGVGNAPTPLRAVND